MHKKIDVYRLMDSQKTREYEVTGAQKKTDAYKLMDSQKKRVVRGDGCTEEKCCAQVDGFLGKWMSTR